MTRRPAGRSNGAGRGPRGGSGSSPRGSNRGPTSGICGAVVYVPALFLAVALLADWVWGAR